MPEPEELVGRMTRRLQHYNLPQIDETAALIGWAARQLRSASVGWDLYRYARPHGDNNALGVRMGEIDIACQNLVYRCVVTAMDLCGGAVSRIAGMTPPPNRERDIAWWLRENQRNLRRPNVPLHLANWLLRFDSSQEWRLLVECRDMATHRTTRRGITVDLGAGRARVLIEAGGQQHDIEDLMPMFLRFGRRRYGGFARALAQQYPLS